MPANRYETLATWYFRFNGYFTTPDFVVHKDFRVRPGGTDADVLAVRFPFSREYQRRFNFERDQSLFTAEGKVDFVICETKAGMCNLNESWRNPQRENVQYVARWMGFERDDNSIAQLAESLYKTGSWEDQDKTFRFVVVGRFTNADLSRDLPNVTQITHQEVITFLLTRFQLDCEGINRQHWDREIAEFADLCAEADLERLLKWLDGE